MKQKQRGLATFALYAFLTVFILFLTPRYLLEKIDVKGISMENTLETGEQVLIEKVSRYFTDPDRFSIVVFERQTGERVTTYIKRVIGLPGETVQIIGTTIYINGEPLDDTYGIEPIADGGIAVDPITLGKGEFFLLGDNRGYSIDSRDSRVGIVKKEEIVGTVFFRLTPLSRIGSVR